MKLIDADALKGRIDKCVTLSGVGLEPLMAVRDIKALISVMPTIDAIPVEWIENMLKEWLKGSASFEMCGAISAMLVRWREEQEAR